MEHIVDFVCFAPMVQILDAPVPQTVEQLPDILRFFDTLMPDPEQVVEVPMILPEDVSMRTVVREKQLVEQLVEVPTIVSTSTFQFLVVEGEFLVFKVSSWKEEDTIVAMARDAAGRTWFLDRTVVAGGGCRVRATPSGTTRRSTPPGQGGKEILARDNVDAPSIMQLVFQQSKSYVFFAAFQFPRQSAVFEQGC